MNDNIYAYTKLCLYNRAHRSVNIFVQLYIHADIILTHLQIHAPIVTQAPQPEHQPTHQQPTHQQPTLQQPVNQV